MPRKCSIGPIERTCEYCGRAFRVWPSSLLERPCRFCSQACMGAAHRRPLAERFWEKVAVGEPDECWPWQGATDGHGYGVINLGRKGRIDKASRVSYTIEHGAIPDGLYVLHHCDNPACVNPAHLSVGTQADNIHDCIAKGRAAHQRKRS